LLQAVVFSANFAALREQLPFLGLLQKAGDKIFQFSTIIKLIFEMQMTGILFYGLA